MQIRKDKRMFLKANTIIDGSVLLDISKITALSMTSNIGSLDYAIKAYMDNGDCFCIWGSYYTSIFEKDKDKEAEKKNISFREKYSEACNRYYDIVCEFVAAFSDAKCDSKGNKIISLPSDVMCQIDTICELEGYGKEYKEYINKLKGCTESFVMTIK